MIFKFICSIFDPKDLPNPYFKEILILGKSNVGKSSFINNITQQNKLAISSNTPGRTKCLNIFRDEEKKINLIDSPGYGFAKISKNLQVKWQELIENAINRHTVKYILILIDSRRGISEQDNILLNILHQDNAHKVIIISTKNDKKDSKKIEHDQFKVFHISNKTKENINNIKKYIDL